MFTLNIARVLFAALLGLTYGLKSVSAFGFSRNAERQMWTSPRVLSAAPFTRPVVSSLGMSGGPATLEPPTTTKKKEKSKDAVKDEEQKGSQGNWEVRLFNDPMNKREFVARCLMEIVGLSDGSAYQVGNLRRNQLLLRYIFATIIPHVFPEALSDSFSFLSFLSYTVGDDASTSKWIIGDWKVSSRAC